MFFAFYKHILRIQPVFTYFKRLFLVPKWVPFSGGSNFPYFLPLKSLKKRVGYGIPSYVVLNNYQIKEVNDTEKGLIFKQILTQKT